MQGLGLSLREGLEGPQQGTLHDMSMLVSAVLPPHGGPRWAVGSGPTPSPNCSVKEGANKEVLGILVSYRVKVKLVVSRGG